MYKEGTLVILKIIGVIGILGTAIFANWDKIFVDHIPYRFTTPSPIVKQSSASVWTKPVPKPITILQPPNTVILNYTSNIIEDEENSEWNYKDPTTASFSYRFINTSFERLNCVIEFKSGYCKENNNCNTETSNADWTEKEAKVFSFIVEAHSPYELTGEISQFPEDVSGNCVLNWKTISAQKIK